MAVEVQGRNHWTTGELLVTVRSLSVFWSLELRCTEQIMTEEET